MQFLSLHDLLKIKTQLLEFAEYPVALHASKLVLRSY